ncbi:hypothetical protein BYT27DRAFT_7125790 [Phlegmacium glaucopus]|nr:hypothetical protein BYT27DRAFT_7125790 [Phlegmacium glaucopus]
MNIRQQDLVTHLVPASAAATRLPELEPTWKDGRTKHVNNRCATQYVPTITALKDHHWESILDTVHNILGEDGKKRKRSKSLSSRASLEFDLDEVDAEEDYILVSDDD